MSDNINYWVNPENIDRKTVEAELNECVRRWTCEEDGQGGHGLDNPIRWIFHVCLNYDDAQAYIESHDKGSYDQLAVMFYEYPTLEPSKAMITLQNRLRAERDKRITYEETHGVDSFKAEYVGCPECGSKLKRALLRGNSCPLCKAELRRKTTLDTLKRYAENIRDIKEKMTHELRKMQKRQRKKAKVNWLIKTEHRN